MIISAALSLIAAVVCAVLGVNRCSRQKGALISGALLGLAGNVLYLCNKRFVELRM